MGDWAAAVTKTARPAAPVAIAPATATGGTAYGRAALEREAEELRATTEGGRNDRLNKAAFAVGQLVAGGELDEAEARAALTSAARVCGLQSEIAATLQSGITSGMREPRSAPPRASSPVPRARSNGGDPPDEPPDGRFDDYEAEALTPTQDDPLRGLEHLAAVALVGRSRILDLAARPISYVWQDIAAPGTICLLAGKSGDGKTTLLFLVLGARANLEAPITLLGRQIQPAPPGQFIVLIEGEHSEASAARKLVQSLNLLGVDDMALERVIIVARKAVRLGSPEWADVVRLVAAGLVSDIAIDTVARVAPGDADSEREQVAIFEGVAQAIEQAPEGVEPPSVWAVAHLRKGNAGGGLDEVSGSAQRVGQADSVLMLAAERVDGRVVSSTVTFAKLREDPDEWPEPAELVIGRGAAGARTLATGAIAPEKTDDRPLEARVLDLLALGPKTKSSLAVALKRSKQDVDGAITTLFEARRIATTTVTVRGQPRKGFELRTEGNSARGPIRDSIRDPQSHGTDTGPNRDYSV